MSFFGKNNIDLCIDYKNKIAKEIINSNNNFKPINYETVYDHLDDGTSVAYITDFILDSGKIRVFCVDWSKVTEEKRNFTDNVTYTLSSNIFSNWLDNEAN